MNSKQNFFSKNVGNHISRWYGALNIVGFLLMLSSLIIIGVSIKGDINKQSQMELEPRVLSLAQTMSEFIYFQEKVLQSTAQKIGLYNEPLSNMADILHDISFLNEKIKAVVLLDLENDVIASDDLSNKEDWKGLFSSSLHTDKTSIGIPFRMNYFDEHYLPIRIPIYNNIGELSYYLGVAYKIIGADGIWNNTLVDIKNASVTFAHVNGQIFHSYPNEDSVFQSFSTAKTPADIYSHVANLKNNQNLKVELFIKDDLVFIDAIKVPDFSSYVFAQFSYNDLWGLWFQRIKSAVLVILGIYFSILLILQISIRRARKIDQERFLAQSNVSKLSKAIEQSPSSVIVTNNLWVTEYANKKLLDASGDVIDIKINTILVDSHPHDLLKADLEKIHVSLELGENWYCERSVESSQQWFSFSISKMVSGNNIDTNESFIIITQDITERKKVEARLYKQAYHDALTGLPNRRNSSVLLQKELVNARKNDSQVALVYLDLDNFKSVNDRYGHSIGDQLLQTIARRLENVMYKKGTACHMSGDEFLAFLPYEDKGMVIQLIEHLIDQITNPITLEGKELFVTMSLGVSCFPDDCSDEIVMLKNADVALYFAKESGRNCYRFYDENLQAKNKRKMELESEIRLALEREELYMVYQTKNKISDYSVCSFEALMRWNSPKLGFVGPDEFVAAAETIGAIEKMGEFALYQACKDLKKFQQEVEQPLTMAVNLSMRQLRNDDIVDIVRNVIKQENIEPASLELEITETMLAESFDVVLPVLNKLLDLGISLSIDDFGTGYSSLNYLTRFPVNTLKVDRCFIMDMVNNSKDSALTESVILMAHRLGLKVVAEGIEEQSQIEILQRFKCDIGQGYFYTKPIQADQMIDLLREQPTILKGLRKTEDVSIDLESTEWKEEMLYDTVEDAVENISTENQQNKFIGLELE